MSVHGRMIRVIGILGAGAVAGALVATVTSASTTASRTAAASGPAFAVTGSTAGGITTIQTTQTLTFVFTETNHSTADAHEDLDLTNVANVKVGGGGMTCVVPGGAATHPDSPFCEPGLVKPGQHASTVLTTTVTGASGTTARARVCVSNESTGVIGPCKTLSDNIA